LLPGRQEYLASHTQWRAALSECTSPHIHDSFSNLLVRIPDFKYGNKSRQYKIYINHTAYDGKPKNHTLKHQ
jgi:hypothetical protein